MTCIISLGKWLQDYVTMYHHSQVILSLAVSILVPNGSTVTLRMKGSDTVDNVKDAIAQYMYQFITSCGCF